MPANIFHPLPFATLRCFSSGSFFFLVSVKQTNHIRAAFANFAAQKAETLLTYSFEDRNFPLRVCFCPRRRLVVVARFRAAKRSEVFALPVDSAEY